MTAPLFWMFAIATCAGAVAVVLSQSVVRMAFWLIVSLGSTAGLFFMMHADFVGATQLMVYVGGTLVLLIFGVMLTASGPYMQIKTAPSQLVIAGIVGVVFLAMIVTIVGNVDWEDAANKVNGAPWAASAKGFNDESEGNTSRWLGLSFLGLRPDRDLNKDEDAPLSPGYLLPFEIVSVHLLVVLIGAAYLARAKRRVGAATE